MYTPAVAIPLSILDFRFTIMKNVIGCTGTYKGGQGHRKSKWTEIKSEISQRDFSIGLSKTYEARDLLSLLVPSIYLLDRVIHQ